MSASRAAVLSALQEQPQPVPLPALTAATGLHANTVREHLEALERAGLIDRQRSAPSGRGRPAWHYEARPDVPGLDQAEYLGLAATLTAFIDRSSATPRDDAIAAGMQWGRELATARSAAGDGGTVDDECGIRRRILRLTSEAGFAPTTDDDASVLRLTRCPLLQLARAYPTVVCGVHLGIVRGALDSYGADPAGAELTPFAEPGACRLRLTGTAPKQR